MSEIEVVRKTAQIVVAHRKVLTAYRQKDSRGSSRWGETRTVSTIA